MEQLGYNEKKDWRRWVSTSLVLALLIPIGFISGGSSTVEGASLKTITSLNTSSEVGNELSYNVTLNDGSSMHFKGYNFVGEDGPDIRTKTLNHILYSNGTIKKTDGTAINGSGYKAMIEVTPFQKVSTFALRSDGTLWAWGAGTNGQLGIGSKVDRTQPAEVVDPATGDPIKGVKKLYALSKEAVLFVTDTAAYLTGRDAMGLNPNANATPLKITAMPTFTSAANFELGFFNDVPKAFDKIGEQTYSSNSVEINADTEIRWFKVNGVYYTLSDIGNPEKLYGGNYVGDQVHELTYTTFKQTNMDLSKVQRWSWANFKIPVNSSTISNPNASGQGYTLLDNGALSYWGTKFGDYNSSTNPVSDPTKTVIAASGVEKVVGNPIMGSFWYLRDNGYIYGFGYNEGNGVLGVSGTVNYTPQRIRGTNDELVGIVDIAYQRYTGYFSKGLAHTAALRDDGKVVVWNTPSKFTVLSAPVGKFIGMITPKSSHAGSEYLLISSTGELFSVNYQDQISLVKLNTTGASQIAPEGYVPDVEFTAPTYTLSHDKFNKTVVTLSFQEDATKKEFSIDDGVTWTPYASPVVLTAPGVVKFKARSGNEKNYGPELSLSITNEPIVIEAGYPKIADKGNGTFTVEAGTTNTGVKTEVRVDNGPWTTYTGPVTLAGGSHVVDARIVNSGGEELATSNKTINGPTPLPTVAPTATPTVAPTATPTVAPTATPTVEPTATPTVAPTATPTPTLDPTWGNPIGSEDVTFTVLSGGFSSQFSGLLLDNVTISTTNPYQQINSVTNSVIEDSRGSGAGWNYTLKITDFVSDPVVDNSNNTNNLVVKMPSNALSVDVANSTTLAGQSGMVSQTGNHVFSDQPVVLAQANEYQGMGQYQIGQSYTLRVPDKVDIVSAGEGSSYKAGAKTSLRVGTYRSQFTFTLASGI
ncbi:hypothetical protein [Paenibacillus sonchi]|uniref:hypothetical protein n=1 Tax=Paenibacillus sonchi TaxID=373687 RepID=UPI001E3FC499|nr:hypothetical protein [Paenibacillus sonchi]MCE3203474.1 hypothetical protein [Paenibacillus sonchi]